MSKILLQNIYCLAKDFYSKPLNSVDLLIINNKINKIAKAYSISKDVNTRVIDCSTHTVIPGLVNTHHHFYQTLTRNLPKVQNAKLFDWLVYLYDIWKYLDEESIYYSSILAMAELAKTGCTLTTDHHYLYPNGVNKDIMDLQFEAAEIIGMRFSPTRGSMSFSKKDGGLPPDSVVQKEDTILKDCERVITKYHDSSEFSMKKIILAPCSPFSVSKNLMLESSRLARKYNVRLHTHLAETKDENNFCMSIYGKRPLDLMEESEFIGKDVFYAHGIHFNDEELKKLSFYKTSISHCPSSNMRLGSGVCRVREMIDMGINVSIGVDGSASNDSSDMLNEIRNTLLLQRVINGSSALKHSEALKLGTINGAKLLGYDKVGKLEEGWAADIAIFDMNSIAYAGSLSDPIAALIFSGYDHRADYTIINGEIVVDKKELVGINEELLIKKANECSKKLYSKSNIPIKLF